jgi:benzodiazapine receptor
VPQEKNGGKMGRYISFITFLVIVLGGGLIIGSLTPPDDWFAQLNKPIFDLPGWLFGPVWTALYILIAIVGWRWWHRDRSSPAMKFWYGQLALNFLWSPVFFSAHQVGMALAVILLLLLIILAFICATWRRDQLSAWLFIPYAAWVAFASFLNASIFALN